MAISNFIPTVWSENLYTAMDAEYIAVANCNRDFEGEILHKGSVVKICGVGEVTLGDYTKDTDMSAPQALSDTVRELKIDRAKYFNFQIDDIDKVQCTPKLMDAAVKNAAATLVHEADEYVFKLYSKATQTVTAEDVNVDNVLDYILEARQKLMEEGNVTDASEVVLEISPAIASLIYKAKLLIVKDNADMMETGYIGSLYGCKIFVSNNIFKENTTDKKYHKCFMRTKRAIAFAEQLSEIDAYRPEKRFADAVKGLHLYGADVIYPNEFVVLNLGVAK